VARLYPVPPSAVAALLAAGVVLGALGDALLRAPGPPGLNMSIWIASVAVAALALHKWSGLTLDRDRLIWLTVGVLFAAGLAWRDAPLLKLLALGCATLTFAIAAHRIAGSWVRRSGVVRYGWALALGALHAWTASFLALVDATLSTRRVDRGGTDGLRIVLAVARGLIIALPLVVVFGALFMAADAVFEEMVTRLVRFDFEWAMTHVVLFSIFAWISTGYLRGFLSGTELPLLADLSEAMGNREGSASGWRRPTLGIIEIGTALGAMDLLFLVFVVVQFRYLFGSDALVQITPDLTYAEYARRGFFELVFAVVLIVPILLAADWLLDRRVERDGFLFRALASVMIALVLVVTASALQRLRLYHQGYGLTEARFYAMLLLFWIGAMLLWLAATVLRGRRDLFAFGALSSGLATGALVFAISPDALIARTNVARMSSEDTAVRFDVAYATRLSADAVPVLMDALPSLPADVRCPLALHMLRRWPPDRETSLRSWNWSASRATMAVRANAAQLRSMLGPDGFCGS